MHKQAVALIGQEQLALDVPLLIVYNGRVYQLQARRRGLFLSLAISEPTKKNLDARADLS